MTQAVSAFILLFPGEKSGITWESPAWPGSKRKNIASGTHLSQSFTTPKRFSPGSTYRLALGRGTIIKMPVIWFFHHQVHTWKYILCISLLGYTPVFRSLEALILVLHWFSFVPDSISQERKWGEPKFLSTSNLFLPPSRLRQTHAIH